ncbi:MAG: glucan ABC transporter ATP-binding protein/ permease, partial [Rhabdaerophilum sp.]
MSLPRLYFRVLMQLGPELRLGLVLVMANLALATAMFAEPYLFGQIINLLTGSQAQGSKPTLEALLPLIGLWLAFGLVSIVGGVTVALHADRMSHRRRLGVMATYFEHVLTLP